MVSTPFSHLNDIVPTLNQEVSMSEAITYTRVTGKRIEEVISDIEPSLRGKDSNEILMACLSIAVMLQGSEALTLTQLVDGVKGASEWIALYHSSLDQPAEKVN